MIHKTLPFLIFTLFAISQTYGQTKKALKDTINTSKVNTTIEDDTINVGYGTTLKSRSVETISVITREQMSYSINQSIQQAIQGRVAGVTVSPSVNYGGNDMKVRIRGINSALGNNEPLYVIDGMPVENIEMLNPAEVEKIEVLKDAASCAIYGSRGANGVVLISTKRK